MVRRNDQVRAGPRSRCPSNRDHLQVSSPAVEAGPTAANTATAHKIAIVFYTVVTKQVEYDDTIWAMRDANRQKRFEARLKCHAQLLGC